MRLIRGFRAVTVTLACLGCLLPAGNLPAAPPQNAATPKPVLQDVRLTQQGTLAGQVLDVNGQPVKQQLIALVQTDKALAETRTDAAGRFAFKQLRAGVYYVTDGRIALGCRVWTNQAAPPAAQPQVLLINGAEHVRGQQPISQLFVNPLVIALVIAAAVAVPLAINHSKEKQSGS